TGRVGGRNREPRGRGDGKTGETNDQGVMDNEGVDRGNNRNQNDNAVNDNIHDDVRNVIDISGCGDDQKVKYTPGSFVGKALTWWNSQIQTRSQETDVGLALGRF
ncbi:hypothetical protein Tco_0259173, partial [Tanacetum coccineum]